MKRVLVLFLLIFLSISCSISYAAVKTGGENSAYASTTKGNYPVEYITFYNYGQKKDSTRFQIDLYLSGPITRYGQDLSLRKHKLAIMTPKNLYKAEFTDENTDCHIWGSFMFYSCSFRLSQ